MVDQQLFPLFIAAELEIVRRNVLPAAKAASHLSDLLVPSRG